MRRIGFSKRRFDVVKTRTKLKDASVLRSKLWRNLKPGDKFRVSCAGVPYREKVCTVTKVQEVRRAWFSGKRQWEIHADYPWWWPCPIRAYADERTELVTEGVE